MIVTSTQAGPSRSLRYPVPRNCGKKGSGREFTYAARAKGVDDGARRPNPPARAAVSRKDTPGKSLPPCRDPRAKSQSRLRKRDGPNRFASLPLDKRWVSGTREDTIH